MQPGLGSACTAGRHAVHAAAGRPRGPGRIRGGATRRHPAGAEPDQLLGGHLPLRAGHAGRCDGGCAPLSLVGEAGRRGVACAVGRACTSRRPWDQPPSSTAESQPAQHRPLPLLATRCEQRATWHSSDRGGTDMHGLPRQSAAPCISWPAALQTGRWQTAPVPGDSSSRPGAQGCASASSRRRQPCTAGCTCTHGLSAH